MRGLFSNRGGRAHEIAVMRSALHREPRRLRMRARRRLRLRGTSTTFRSGPRRCVYRLGVQRARCLPVRQARMHLPRTRRCLDCRRSPPVFRPLAKSLGLRAASSRMDAEPSAIAGRVGQACAAVVAATNPRSIPVHPRRAPSSVASCGGMSDGCGGIVHCGNCVPPETCGGGAISRNAAARRGPVLRGARNAARFPTAAVKCSTAGLVPMAHRAARMAGPTAADACPPLAKPKT